MCVPACAHVCVCACACVRVCVHLCLCVSVSLCLCAGGLRLAAGRARFLSSPSKSTANGSSVGKRYRPATATRTHAPPTWQAASWPNKTSCVCFTCVAWIGAPSVDLRFTVGVRAGTDKDPPSPLVRVLQCPPCSCSCSCGLCVAPRAVPLFQRVTSTAVAPRRAAFQAQGDVPGEIGAVPISHVEVLVAL